MQGIYLLKNNYCTRLWHMPLVIKQVMKREDNDEVRILILIAVRCDDVRETKLLMAVTSVDIKRWLVWSLYTMDIDLYFQSSKVILTLHKIHCSLIVCVINPHNVHLNHNPWFWNVFLAITIPAFLHNPSWHSELLSISQVSIGFGLQDMITQVLKSAHFVRGLHRNNSFS